MTESIVVSLELAKKLKEVGYPQLDSSCIWRSHDPDLKHTLNIDGCDCFPGRNGEWYAAPTAEEVLRRLPNSIEDYHLKIRNAGNPHYPSLEYVNGEHVIMRRADDNECFLTICEDSLADAAAKMYIHLAENNLLPPQS